MMEIGNIVVGERGDVLKGTICDVDEMKMGEIG